jgi:hypothetical protein
LGAEGTGGAVATAPSDTGAGFGAAPFPAELAGAGLAGALSGLPPPNDSRKRRATGASTVDEADLTNSP